MLAHSPQPRHHPDILAAHSLFHQLHQLQLPHTQQLENFQQLQQGLQSLTLPPQRFLATPLTPQSHASSFAASPPACSSACVSPSYSSPAFSTQNSPSTDFASFPQSAGAVSMPDRSFRPQPAAGLSHTPPIRVHHSLPPFGEQGFAEDITSQMLLQSGLPADNTWESQRNPVKRNRNAQSGTSRSAQLGVYDTHRHKRASSGSSGVSVPTTDAVSPLAPSAAPFSPSTLSGYDRFDSANQSSSTTSKHLPTPEQTPITTSFLAPPFQSYNPSSPRDGDYPDVDMAMRRIMEQQKQHQATTTDDEVPYAYSLAPSVSTLSHNSPATPQTNFPDDFDDGLKSISNGEDRFSNVDRWMDDYLRFDASADFNGHASSQMGVPKLGRTLSDIYQDELYNPTLTPTSQVRKAPTKNAKHFPPYRNFFTDRLQAAHQGHMSARSNSPTSSINRDQSPFRQGSPFAQTPSSYHGAHMSQSSHLHSEIQLGGQQPPDMRGMELGSESSAERGGPKTISPKDALLEYHEPSEEHGMSELPPPPDASQYHIPTTMASSSTFQSGPNFPSVDTFHNQYEHPGPVPQQFPYVQGQQHLQQLPLQLQSHQQVRQVQQQQGQRKNKPAQQTSEFRPHLSPIQTSSREQTTTGGSGSPARQMQRTTALQSTESARRPEDTSSDLGTYSCTYHGCTLRFETPTKLQKHKRESHRQSTPGSHAGGRDAPAGANSLAMRNSQAGPHRCERINPSTGKPCNSIFSRPYDLTRHEDTIHNARKQKVRCHLCTEEKTFSRNDALTRHMRVVHPEIDWPGKQKRKSKD
jgi:hypothetical protein